MSSYAELQADFDAALAAGTPPRDLTAPDPAETARRFAVYQNNVMASLREALGRRFLVVARLVGAEFAAALFAAFARAHPPESPLMFRYGARMPGFLETFPPVRGLPYLPDVARLELARGRAYHAADAVPATAEALAAASDRDPETLVFRLHPSVEVVTSDHPVHSIWAMNQPGATLRPIAAGTPEAALVARTRDRILTERIGPDAADFIAALASGASLAAAAGAARGREADFDPAPALARLIAAGLVTGIETTDGRPEP